MSLKGIKRLVSYGLISLTGFNLFVGCSSPYEPELSTIEFELDTRLSMDSNGYYHLTLDTTKWQTPHRLSGYVYRDGKPMNVLKFGLGSNHYFII